MRSSKLERRFTAGMREFTLRILPFSPQKMPKQTDTKILPKSAEIRQGFVLFCERWSLQESNQGPSDPEPDCSALGPPKLLAPNSQKYRMLPGEKFYPVILRPQFVLEPQKAHVLPCEGNKNGSFFLKAPKKTQKNTKTRTFGGGIFWALFPPTTFDQKVAKIRHENVGI